MTEKEFDDLMFKACQKISEDEAGEFENIKDADIEFSDRFKVRMNRMFREQAGIKRVPYPEVDTWFERVKSSFNRRILIFRHHHSKSRHNTADSAQ